MSTGKLFLSCTIAIIPPALLVIATDDELKAQLLIRTNWAVKRLCDKQLDFWERATLHAASKYQKARIR